MIHEIKRGEKKEIENSPPGLKSLLTPASRHGSKPPLTQSNRVLFVKSHPLVYALTPSSVAPLASPTTWPSAGGKNSGHWRLFHSSSTRRETIEGRPCGAPFCQYPNGWLQRNQYHCLSKVLESETSVYIGLLAL